MKRLCINGKEVSLINPPSFTGLDLELYSGKIKQVERKSKDVER